MMGSNTLIISQLEMCRAMNFYLAELLTCTEARTVEVGSVTSVGDTGQFELALESKPNPRSEAAEEARELP